MFKAKIIISSSIFLIFIITTSIIKNQTRVIEKKLYKLDNRISLKEKDVNEAQLDFYFLTSPSQIEKKIKVLGYDNYFPIENSNIFASQFHPEFKSRPWDPAPMFNSFIKASKEIDIPTEKINDTSKVRD